MHLVTVIFLSVLFASPIWIGWRAVRRRADRRLRRERSSTREVILGTFFFYLVIVAAITIVPRVLSETAIPIRAGINLIPGTHSLRTFLPNINSSPESVRFWLQNILGNIFLFVPFGALVPLLSRRFESLGRVARAALLTSISIEAIQFLSRFLRVYRSVDIDDVLLNVLGACIGFLFYLLVKRFVRTAGRGGTIRIVNARR